jgi:acetylornithine deacetylase/succinyl-diaminopimelate desuccinylase-like protein
MVATLEKTLGAPAILLPFGQSSDNPHLENERIRGMNLMRGKNMIKHFLQEVAEKMSA